MKKNHYLFLLLLIAALLEFWQLGTQPLQEFDEARYAVNAAEMMQNGDYINLHYDGRPDTWVARPPLKAWFIIGGYKLLGFNEWGLRLSSGLAILLFFFFAFRLINLYLPAQRAFLGCLFLLSVKGIIGFHVGRNADMDAELIAFLTGGTYYFLRYLDFNEPRSAWFAGLFFGLSFWIKTTAAFYCIPGLVLYVIFSGKFKGALRDKYFWTGITVFLGIIATWFILLQVYGVSFVAEKSYHTHKNSWETMLFYDTWSRFTSSNFDNHPVEVNRSFFFDSIDVIFNIWNYFFYAGLAFFAFRMSTKQRRTAFMASSFYKISLMALCVLFPIVLLLTFGMHKLYWYTAPSLVFLSILALYAVDELEKLWRYNSYIVYGVVLFAIVRNFLLLQEISKEKNELTFLKAYKVCWKSKSTVQAIDGLTQNMHAYFLWNGKKVVDYGKAPVDNNSIYLGEVRNFKNFQQNFSKVAEFPAGLGNDRPFFMAEIKQAP